MRAASFALLFALVLGGCGPAPNRLEGSLADVYSLDFDTVQGSLVGSVLVVEYLRSASGARPLKLTVETTALTAGPGQPIDLAETIGNGPRGTLQRIVEQTTELPLKKGTLTLDTAIVADQPLTGSFLTTLTNPAGRTLNGAFQLAKVVKR